MSISNTHVGLSSLRALHSQLSTSSSHDTAGSEGVFAQHVGTVSCCLYGTLEHHSDSVRSHLLMLEVCTAAG